MIISSWSRLTISSTGDVIMNEPLPYKGVVLNQITIFWMDMFKDLVPNHLLTTDVRDFPAKLASYAQELEGRAVLVRKAKPFPIDSSGSRDTCRSTTATI